jgi:hypothetical protein
MGDERQAMEAYQKAAKLFEKDNAQAYGPPIPSAISIFSAILMRGYHL